MSDDRIHPICVARAMDVMLEMFASLRLLQRAMEEDHSGKMSFMLTAIRSIESSKRKIDKLLESGCIPSGDAKNHMIYVKKKLDEALAKAKEGLESVYRFDEEENIDRKLEKLQSIVDIAMSTIMNDVILSIYKEYNALDEVLEELSRS